MIRWLRLLVLVAAVCTAVLGAQRPASQRELVDLLSNPDTADLALQTYFTIDDSVPFSPVFVVKPDVTVTDDQGDRLSMPPILINLANTASTRIRDGDYRTTTRRFPNRIRIVAEGDSWFQHPGPNVLDVVDQLTNYFNIRSLAAAGDVLTRMVRVNDYTPTIQKEKARVLLLSGGGNDILGKLDALLAPVSSEQNVKAAFSPEFFNRVRDVANLYRAIFSVVARELPKEVIVVTHGYDYIVPRSSGPWIGPKLASKGLRSRAAQREAIRFIIDSFNDALRAVAKDFPRVYVVDLRGTVRENQWYDEIHPDNDAFQQIALKFMGQIQDALGPRPN
jgi:hypothetical protein